MIMAPLFIKYQSASGTYYVYDAETNEIVRIGKAIYEILDDFCILEAEEMIEKHHVLGESIVRGALRQLQKLQSRGILSSHAPQLSSKVERVTCEGREQSFESIVRGHRQLLTLELTQQCNLRCEYCCYGEHYPELRKPSAQTMSLETAKSEVTNFMSLCSEECSIGLYGGEPLLEFDLLKNIVLFAEAQARQRGLSVRFSMTTNGTLLTDEKLHFLVAHEFNIMVSLDGNKESHDRHRVFRNDKHPEQGTGSYDVVMRNLRRFVALYPDYKNRGIMPTLTAASDPDDMDDGLRSLRKLFQIIPTVVRNVSNRSEPDVPIGFGRWMASPTGLETRGNERSCVKDDGGNGRRQLPAFCDWSGEKGLCWGLSRERFISEVCRNPDLDAVEQEFPVLYNEFKILRKDFHNRRISNGPAPVCFTCKCFPGASQTFCSAQGRLYPCERTETGKLMELGDVSSGVDVERAVRLTDSVRLLSDCGNCVGKRACPLCLAAVNECESTGRPDAYRLQRKCRSENGYLLREDLIEYTTVMEANPEGACKLLRYRKGKDWRDSIRFLPSEKQLKQTKLENEELEEAV